MDRSSNEKVLVVETDNPIGTSIATVLSEAGYEVSTDSREGMKSVLTFDPDAVILGANPPQLDCCDLLFEIKGSERTQNIRVLMVSPGGSGERTRGLDLGADDVLSLPVGPHELLSRVRLQLRSKRTIEEFRQQVHTVKENQDVARQVVAAASEERRTLRLGVIAALFLVAITAAAFLIFYHRTQQQNTRLCRDNSIANGHVDRTKIDGPIASYCGRSASEPLAGRRFRKASTAETEQGLEIADCGRKR